MKKTFIVLLGVMLLSGIWGNAQAVYAKEINNGGQVVWRGYDENDYEIFLYDGRGEPIQLTDNEYDDYDPQINNGGRH